MALKHNTNRQSSDYSTYQLVLGNYSNFVDIFLNVLHSSMFVSCANIYDLWVRPQHLPGLVVCYLMVYYVEASYCLQYMAESFNCLATLITAALQIWQYIKTVK